MSSAQACPFQDARGAAVRREHRQPGAPTKVWAAREPAAAPAPAPAAATPPPVAVRSPSTSSVVKVPEVSNFTVPALPKPLDAADWLTQVLESVVCASNNSDVGGVQSWFLTVTRTTNPDDLHINRCPVSFKKLDMKLAAALKTVVAASTDTLLNYNITKLNKEVHSKEDGILSGRRIMWEIMGHLRLDSSTATTRALEALTALEWGGDSS